MEGKYSALDSEQPTEVIPSAVHTLDDVPQDHLSVPSATTVVPYSMPAPFAKQRSEAPLHHSRFKNTGSKEVQEPLERLRVVSGWQCGSGSVPRRWV